MRVMSRPLWAAVFVFGLLTGVAATAVVVGAVQSQAPPSKQYRLPGIRQPFSDADINFMSGMIPHHAQAVIMAGWAPSHGAGAAVKLLCERIVVSQKDEIKLMQTWLGDRGQEVPATDATHHKMKMGDMVHEMLMPGMLTDAELKQPMRRAARSSTGCSSRS